MTDYGNVKNELMLIMNCTEEEINPYEIYVQSAVEYVSGLLKSPDCENRADVVYLCAAKAFYLISLVKEAGNSEIKSFKAGDVSYTVGNSQLSAAEKILSIAVSDCRNLLVNDSFVFKAV